MKPLLTILSRDEKPEPSKGSTAAHAAAKSLLVGSSDEVHEALRDYLQLPQSSDPKDGRFWAAVMAVSEKHGEAWRSAMTRVFDMREQQNLDPKEFDRALRLALRIERTPADSEGRFSDMRLVDFPAMHPETEYFISVLNVSREDRNTIRSIFNYTDRDPSSLGKMFTAALSLTQEQLRGDALREELKRDLDASTALVREKLGDSVSQRLYQHTVICRLAPITVVFHSAKEFEEKLAMEVERLRPADSIKESAEFLTRSLGRLHPSLHAETLSLLGLNYINERGMSFIDESPQGLARLERFLKPLSQILSPAAREVAANNPMLDRPFYNLVRSFGDRDPVSDIPGLVVRVREHLRQGYLISEQTLRETVGQLYGFIEIFQERATPEHRAQSCERLRTARAILEKQGELSAKDRETLIENLRIEGVTELRP